MKPENLFIKRVHKHLGGAYAEKMANPYRGGTPDVWYSGCLGDMWVEYKYLPKVPQRGTVKIPLTPLQRKWLFDRYEDQRRVAVIVGCPKGGVVLNGLSWMIPMSAEYFQRELWTTKEIGEYLNHANGPSASCAAKGGVHGKVSPPNHVRSNDDHVHRQ